MPSSTSCATRWRTRSASSAAALRVKVSPSTSGTSTWPFASSQTTRFAMVSVLPLPAPATTMRLAMGVGLDDGALLGGRRVQPEPRGDLERAERRAGRGRARDRSRGHRRHEVHAVLPAGEPRTVAEFGGPLERRCRPWCARPRPSRSRNAASAVVVEGLLHALGVRETAGGLARGRRASLRRARRRSESRRRAPASW